jgi:hypothetical protein
VRVNLSAYGVRQWHTHLSLIMTTAWLSTVPMPKARLV